MAQNIPSCSCLQSAGPTTEPSDQPAAPAVAGAGQQDARPSHQVSAGTRALCDFEWAVIDWRFGVFIHFDTDTYYGPGQISILSQSDAGEYTFRRLAPDVRARISGATATRRYRL